MNTTEQQFLKDLEKNLWQAADKLRNNLDAAVYKHAVLGLIFLKYVSDAFTEQQEILKNHFQDEQHEYYLDPEMYDSAAEYQQELKLELEDRDYYREAKVFWLPTFARWQTLQDNARLAPQTKIPLAEGEYTFKSLGKLIDDMLLAIEKDNPSLKNILNRTYTQLQLPSEKLSDLIDHIATIPLQHESLRAKDILGHVYEYFLGNFALAEGKKGGQYYTPKSIVNLIVRMLHPYAGRVYDPAMGSGGFFVQSEDFIEGHGGRIDAISVYGQESNPTTWRLAAMNMAIHGIDFDFGGKPADSFLNDLHPDLRADYVMANPPFNSREWWHENLADDKRWKYGIPPQSNANFAWMQHMLYHLAPDGSMALLLANGSMSSNTGGEGDIRKNLVDADLVECMVALPGQLFTNTQIPACIWFLTKNKHAHNSKRQRNGEILFIDARNLGYMKDRVLRDFKEEDLLKIAGTFHAWQEGKDYQDEAGFCKSASLAEIQKHDYVMTPGRYVGAPPEEDDGIPFADKMATLTSQLAEQLAESTELEKKIRENLAGLGYGI